MALSRSIIVWKLFGVGGRLGWTPQPTALEGLLLFGPASFFRALLSRLRRSGPGLPRLYGSVKFSTVAFVQDQTVPETVSPEEAPAPPETIEDAWRYASWATWAVTVGKIDANTAHKVGTLLSAFVRARERDLAEKEIQTLRAQLATLRGKTR